MPFYFINLWLITDREQPAAGGARSPTEACMSRDERPVGSEAGHACFSASFTTCACSRRLSAKRARSWPRQALPHRACVTAEGRRQTRRGTAATRSGARQARRLAVWYACGQSQETAIASRRATQHRANNSEQSRNFPVVALRRLPESVDEAVAGEGAGKMEGPAAYRRNALPAAGLLPPAPAPAPAFAVLNALCYAADRALGAAAQRGQRCW